jgi:hypothetical protein
MSWVRDRFRARETYPFALCAGTGECLLRKRATISVHGDLQAWASFIYSSLEQDCDLFSKMLLDLDDII